MIDTNQNGATATSPALVNDNTWTHVAGVVDRGAGEIRLYVNGALTATEPLPASMGSVSNPADLYIGRTHYGNNFHIGLIDEVEIFDRALTQGEIQDIYNAGSAGKCKGCVPPPSGLVSWWPLDETSGPFAYDFWGSNHGKHVGGPVPTPGIVNGSLRFDGLNDYVNVTHDPTLDFGTSNFSIDVWVNPDSMLYNRSIVAKLDQNTAGTFGYILYLRSSAFGYIGQIVFEMMNGTHTARYPPVQTVPAYNWTHIAVTVNRTAVNRTGGEVKIYINASLQLSASIPSSFGSISNTGHFYIGTGLNAPDFGGLIDEVEVYNRTLTASEVSSIYNVTKCKEPCPNPVVSEFTAGIDDNFNTANGPEPSFPSIDLQTFLNQYSGGVRNFDDLSEDKVFGHTYTGLPPIFAATLEVHLRARNTSITPTTDSIGLKFTGATPPFEWGLLLNKLIEFWTSGSQTQWTPGSDYTFVLNLAALPNADGTFTNILPDINTDHTLDVYIQDDTGIDYMKLRITSCHCIDPPPGLISWWPGDGTLMNGATFTAGKVDQAFSFDGIDDYVKVPDDPSLDFGKASDFSIDAWIWWDARDRHDAPIVSKWDEKYGYYFYLQDTNLALVLADDSGSPPTDYMAPFSIPAQEWVLTTVTLDRDNPNGLKFYVNGALVSVFNPTNNSGSLANNEPLRIGATRFGVHSHPNESWWFFNGLIDEVEIYNRTLTASEIQDIYNAGSLGKCKPGRDIGGWIDLPKPIIGQGFPLNVNVTVKNHGGFTETFTVKLYANTTLVGTASNYTVVSIEIVSLPLNTTGLPKGNYTIRAYLSPVPGETNITDNTLIGGSVFVTIPGDVDGDHDVDIFDIVRMSSIYGVSYPHPSYDPNSDTDGDGDIDIFDIVAAATNYGKSW